MILPSHEEIDIAVAEVFDCVRRKCPANLLNSLVVVDTTMDLDHSNINYVVDYEMREICDFANAFKKQLAKTTDRRQQARIKILIYCHIMEADLPLTVFWNLLRILDGAPPDWTFRRRTKAGKDEICESPRQKIAEVNRGFCGVGKHSHKKAAILVTYTGGSNLSCAYVSEGADLMSKIVLGIGIFRYFSIETSSGVGSLR